MFALGLFGGLVFVLGDWFVFVFVWVVLLWFIAMVIGFGCLLWLGWLLACRFWGGLFS